MIGQKTLPLGIPRVSSRFTAVNQTVGSVKQISRCDKVNNWAPIRPRSLFKPVEWREIRQKVREQFLSWTVETLSEIVYANQAVLKRLRRARSITCPPREDYERGTKNYFSRFAIIWRFTVKNYRAVAENCNFITRFSVFTCLVAVLQTICEAVQGVKETGYTALKTGDMGLSEPRQATQLSRQNTTTTE